MILMAGDGELVLAPEIGGTIASWRIGRIDLFRTGTGDAARDQGSYPLVPFSNRVAGGAFTFRGQRHVLPVLLGPWAIHGAGWQSQWETQGNDMVLHHRAGVLWPFAFDCVQSFAVERRSLRLTMRVTNRHSDEAPLALGMHPYFNRSPSTTIAFTAEKVWRNDADMIPEAKVDIPPEWDFRAPGVPEVAIDNCFLNRSGPVVITQPDHQLTITADPVFRHLVVYCPPSRDIMAIEPVTNMNDGLNRMDDPDCGMAVLPPGGVLEGSITFSVAL
jgi:aldose 1-epimerase